MRGMRWHGNPVWWLFALACAAALAPPAAPVRAQEAVSANLATTAALPAIVILRGNLSATSLARGEALTATLVLENPANAPIRGLVAWLDAGEAQSLRWSLLSGPSELAPHTTAAAAFRIEATSEAWPGTVDLHAACHGSLQATDGTTRPAEGFLPRLATLHVHVYDPDDDHPDEHAGVREGPDSLPPGVETTGLLGIGGDWDLFAFPAARPGTYLFEVQSAANPEVALDLLAQDGRSLVASASPDLSIGWKSVRVELTAPGVWYVRVRSETAWRRGQYTVRAGEAGAFAWARASRPAAADQAGQASLAFTTRTLDVDRTPVSGVLASIGEELTYVVAPPRGGWYRFDLGRDQQRRSMPDLEVRDWAWRKLAGSHLPGEERRTLSLPLAKDGPYFVRVSRPSDYGEYGFVLSARRQRVRLGQRPGVLVVREGQPEPVTLPLTNLGGPIDRLMFEASVMPPGTTVGPCEGPVELAAGATALMTFVASAGGAPIGTSAEVALTCRARDADTLAPLIEDRARAVSLVVQPANPVDDHAEASDRALLPGDALVLDGPSVPGALETSGDRDVFLFRTEDVGPHEFQATPELGMWTFLVPAPLPEDAGPVSWACNWFTPSLMTADIAVPGWYSLTVIRLLPEGARDYALGGRALRLQASLGRPVERLQPYRPTPGTLLLKNLSLGFHDVRATLSLEGAPAASATCRVEFGRLLPEETSARDFQLPPVEAELGADRRLSVTVEGRRRPGGALMALGQTDLGWVFVPTSVENDDHANAVATVQDPRDRVPTGGSETTASIETGGDADVFFFDAPEPGWYLIECIPVPPAFNPVLELLDSEERVLDRNQGERSFREAARLTTEAVQPGRHVVGVRLQSQHQTGAYRLRVSREWLALGGPLQISAVRRGGSTSVAWEVTNRGADVRGVAGSLVVTPAEDVTVIALHTPFDLASGQTGRLRYRIEAAAEAGFGSRHYSVHATATAIASGAPVQASFTEAGLLVVSEEPPVSPPDDRPADPEALGPGDAVLQTNGVPFEARGDFDGDEDAFSFVASAPGRYQFEASDESSYGYQPVASLTVFDTDGRTELASWSAASAEGVTGELDLIRSGTYYCRVVSRNQWVSYRVFIRQAALPPVDLVADAVSSSPIRLAVGQQMRLEGQVRNDGGLWAPPFLCSWFLTPVSSPALAIPCSELEIAGLAPGQTATVRADTQYFNPPAGIYRLGFRVEPPPATAEPNQANNTAIATETVEILTLPELEAGGLGELPARLVVGGRYQLQGVVLRRGSLRPAEPVECELYLAPSSGSPAANAVLLGNARTERFSESTYLPWQVRIPDGLPAGPWYLTQVVDPRGRIQETVETNNVRSQPITVAAVEADSLEPNGTLASAAPLHPGTRTLSLVDGDVDWLRFEAGRGDLIRLELVPEYPDRPFDWDVRDPSGRVRVAEQLMWTRRRTPLTFQVSSPGTHLLRVAGEPGGYSLTFRQTPAANSPLNLSALAVRGTDVGTGNAGFVAEIKLSSGAAAPEPLRPPVRVFLSSSLERSTTDGLDVLPEWEASWTVEQLPGPQQIWGRLWASRPVSGPQYLHIIVDPDSDFAETDETDNSAVSATPIELPAWADGSRGGAPVLVSPPVLDFGDLPPGGFRCRRLRLTRAGAGEMMPWLGALPPELSVSWIYPLEAQPETITGEITLRAATRPGPYRTDLSVTSGSPASVTIVPIVANVVECPDPPPVAWAGEDVVWSLEHRGVRQDRPLTGATASDPDLTPVFVDWRIAGSSSPGAMLADAASLTPTLVVTQPGMVVVEMTARSGFPPLAASDWVVVTVADPNDPSAAAGAGQAVLAGGGCRLSRRASADAVTVGDLALLASPLLLVLSRRPRRARPGSRQPSRDEGYPGLGPERALRTESTFPIRATTPSASSRTHTSKLG